VTEAALERASDPSGVGSLVFTRLYESEARHFAHLQDSGGAGHSGALSGIPISIKDLFDVRGEVTTAGSIARAGSKEAMADAVAVSRLKQAGSIIVGRTNMTEFAFSGVGLNPHYGTPPNAYKRESRLIPGGSSSGAAVSVSDGMALAALGSDTGGSIRIPAALCGLVGFKPTQCRVPTDGMFALSPTLDSVGVMGQTVSCCHTLDAVLSGETATSLQETPLCNVVLAIPQNYLLDALDAHVAQAFGHAVSRLASAGTRILEIDLPEISAIPAVNAKGGFAAAEAYMIHRNLHPDMEGYDPLVKERILRGRDISSEECKLMVTQRHAIIDSFAHRWDSFDAIVCPTVPIVAPKISSLEASADEFRRTNLLLLRNPSIANFLDLCAISIPCHKPGEPPVGLMLTGKHGEDKRLLSLALAVENTLAQ
jgi:aspartyl-tRNA(Asn)/glutamyl-tRNA(Gln) amidotransferase subunit A